MSETRIIQNQQPSGIRHYIIDQMRTIAIIAIVLHHSITLWPPELRWPIQQYWGLLTTKIAVITGLGSFTLMSGWLLGLTASHYTDALTFLKKKSVRLLLPAVFWGLVYFVAFNGGYSGPDVPMCINGSHLWYFLMLFLCMVASMPLIFMKSSSSTSYICIAVIYAIGILLQTYNRTFLEFVRYFPIFLLGWALCRYRVQIDNIPVWIRAWTSIILWGALYVLIRINNYDMPWFTIEYATAALALYMMLTCVSLPCRSIVRWISAGSFAIYIIHQFVINWFCTYNAYWLQAMPYAECVATIFVVAFFTPLIIKRLWPKLL